MTLGVAQECPAGPSQAETHHVVRIIAFFFFSFLGGGGNRLTLFPPLHGLASAPIGLRREWRNPNVLASVNSERSCPPWPLRFLCTRIRRALSRPLHRLLCILAVPRTHHSHPAADSKGRIKVDLRCFIPISVSLGFDPMTFPQKKKLEYRSPLSCFSLMRLRLSASEAVEPSMQLWSASKSRYKLPRSIIEVLTEWQGGRFGTVGGRSRSTP